MDCLSRSGSYEVGLDIFRIIVLKHVRTLSFHMGSRSVRTARSILGHLGVRRLTSHGVVRLDNKRQRLMFVTRTLMGRPEVLLLSRPADTLSLRGRFGLLALLGELARRGRFAALIALRRLSLTTGFTSRVVVLRGNRICVRKGPRRVFARSVVRRVCHIGAGVCVSRRNIPRIVPLRTVA